jgi:hypothetical protein
MSNRVEVATTGSPERPFQVIDLQAPEVEQTCFINESERQSDAKRVARHCNEEYARELAQF